MFPLVSSRSGRPTKFSAAFCLAALMMIRCIDGHIQHVHLNLTDVAMQLQKVGFDKVRLMIDGMDALLNAEQVDDHDNLLIATIICMQ